MAEASTVVTTSASSLQKVWRKIQGDVAEGIQYKNVEWDMMEDFVPPEGTVWSAREVTIPIDIKEGAGVASIVEGGTEALPSSPNLAEITVTLVQFNKRFNASLLAKYGDSGDENQVKRQLTHQGAHAIRDLSRHFSDYFHGVSNAYLAQVVAATTATTGTYTLSSGYGVSGITSTAFIAQKFKASDRVALIRSGSLVSNAIGTVSSITSSAVMVVVWNGSVVSASGDYVVKANSMENTTIDGTDYSRGLVGLIDITTASSVHSLATSTEADWDIAYSDTAAGRFSGIKLRRADDEIDDEGGGRVNTVLMSKGVRRDFIALERAALRFNDPFGMEVDGDVKSKGRKFIASKRVPPGYVYCFDKSALSRWALLPKPSGKFSWGDGKEYINQNAMVFRIDMPVATICKNRKKFAYFTSQTEQ